MFSVPSPSSHSPSLKPAPFHCVFTYNPYFPSSKLAKAWYFSWGLLFKYGNFKEKLRKILEIIKQWNRGNYTHAVLWRDVQPNIILVQQYLLSLFQAPWGMLQKIKVEGREVKMDEALIIANIYWAFYLCQVMWEVFICISPFNPLKPWWGRSFWPDIHWGLEVSITWQDWRASLWGTF